MSCMCWQKAKSLSRAARNSRSNSKPKVMRNMPASPRDAMNADVRAMKTPAEQALSAAYQAARGNLPGMGAVAALRADACQPCERGGLPRRRVEEWKYTDLRALMREAYPLAAPPDASAKAAVKEAGACFFWL